VGGLAIPTTHTRIGNDVIQDREQSSVEMGRRKFKGQPDLPLNEKPFINNGKHHRKTKAKINPEKL
jgi:hypothetical protein